MLPPLPKVFQAASLAWRPCRQVEMTLAPAGRDRIPRAAAGPASTVPSAAAEPVFKNSLRVLPMG